MNTNKKIELFRIRVKKKNANTVKQIFFVSSQK